MDFELSTDQVALADGVRALIAGHFALEAIRRREGQPVVIDPDGWAALGQAGVFALRVPEGAGGVGLGLAEATIVFEELGRALVPGPLVTTHLAATLAAVTEDETLMGAAQGALVVASVRTEDDPILVEHFGSLGAVIGFGPSGALMHYDPAHLKAAIPLSRSLDPLTPLTHLESLEHGQSLVVPPEQLQAWTNAERVLVGAQCVGLAAAACDLAVEYAKGRSQFGRPIGSFQAVKHLCADMATRAEVARAGIQAAAVTADQPDVGDVERAAAGAALLAVQAAVANAKTCIQVHGGMGFTWEVPAHLYLMRAKFLASTLGPARRLARTVAERY
jgi:alkylation response protein AidB-like acyl-CoA dehydrogenase